MPVPMPRYPSTGREPSSQLADGRPSLSLVNWLTPVPTLDQLKSRPVPVNWSSNICPLFLVNWSTPIPTPQSTGRQTAGQLADVLPSTSPTPYPSTGRDVRSTGRRMHVCPSLLTSLSGQLADKPPSPLDQLVNTRPGPVFSAGQLANRHHTTRFDQGFWTRQLVHDLIQAPKRAREKKIMFPPRRPPKMPPGSPISQAADPANWPAIGL